jgi:hypothetical protein
MKIILICILVGYVLYKLSSVKVYTNTRQGFNPPRPEGHTRVETPKPPKPKRTDFKGGEYVDYEEIK